jgi:hypothetical protein
MTAEAGREQPRGGSKAKRAAPANGEARAERAVRTPWTVRLYLVLSWVMGWWMALDGLHERLWGDYVRLNGQLGPWAGLAQAVGVEPQRLGMTFVALGLALIGASFGVTFRRRWGYNAALATAAISLLYLGLGTPIALACLVLLLLKPTREFIEDA